MEYFVAEYSASQDSFHRQPFKEALRKNMERAARKEQNDWVMVGMGSGEEVDAIIKLIQALQNRLPK